MIVMYKKLHTSTFIVHWKLQTSHRPLFSIEIFTDCLNKLRRTQGRRSGTTILFPFFPGTKYFPQFIWPSQRKPESNMGRSSFALHIDNGGTNRWHYEYEMTFSLLRLLCKLTLLFCPLPWKCWNIEAMQAEIGSAKEKRNNRSYLTYPGPFIYSMFKSYFKLRFFRKNRKNLKSRCWAPGKSLYAGIRLCKLEGK